MSSWTDRIKRSLGLARPEPPAWYRLYGERIQQMPDPKTPIDQLCFVVLDVETTGLNPRQDKLLSIGSLKVKDRHIILEEAIELYLDPPEGHKKTKAVAIHGLVPGASDRTYVDEETALRRVIDQVGNHILVGHHLNFDIAVLNAALSQLQAPRLQNLIVDTAKLAKRSHPPLYGSPPQQYSLDELARQYRIPLSDRHTALGDCFITAILLLKLLHALEQLYQRPLKLEDLL